jgi:hypothetical protein
MSCGRFLLIAIGAARYSQEICTQGKMNICQTANA